VESGATLSSAAAEDLRSERTIPGSAHVPHGSPPSEDVQEPAHPRALTIAQPSFDPSDVTPCVLGIDLGTTAVKVVVISKETSQVGGFHGLRSAEGFTLCAHARLAVCRCLRRFWLPRMV
jgi:hypothetical protein